MSLLAVVLLSLGTAAQRLVGMFVGGRRLRHPALARLADLVPAAILAAVIAQLTLATGRRLVVDARLAGVVVAALLTWRGRPLAVVVLGAAAVTAALRALGVA